LTLSRTTAQAAAVAQTEHYAGLEAVGNRQQPLRFIRAYHHWNLLRRAQVIHLGGEVASVNAQGEPHLATIAKRFSALAHRVSSRHRINSV
jgi:hypothetical protein